MALPADLDSIKGWFYISDRELIPWILDRQHTQGITGDVVELGCYLGKSAVVIGQHIAPEETFTVLDLFEGPGQDAANDAEQRGSYSTLSRVEFESNYLRFHDALPVVVQDLSSAITKHVAPGSVRFMHIDASHLYEHVRHDVESARSLLQPDGVVVFDDYRSEHTPGVAGAVWEAVVRDGLVPIALTPSKFYATWGDPAPWVTAIEAWARSQGSRVWIEHQAVLGHDLLRVKVLTAPEGARPKSAVAQNGAARASRPQGGVPGAAASSDGSARVRALLKEISPPIIARRLHRLRLRVESSRAARH